VAAGDRRLLHGPGHRRVRPRHDHQRPGDDLDRDHHRHIADHHHPHLLPTSTTTGDTTTATTDASADPTTTTTTTTTTATTEQVGGIECDLYQQDCPEGSKCAPYIANDDEVWDDAHCILVVDRPVGLGFECMILGSEETQVDDCDVGLICWNTGTLTCEALCGGGPDVPKCSSGPCVLADGLPPLCKRGCDPLTPDCGGEQLCVPAPAGPPQCFTDASGDQGQLFGACMFANSCDYGLACFEPTQAAECDPDEVGCCLPLCDLAAPECPGAGQSCMPLYGADAPIGYADLGFCGLAP
jgi:hypothetical protein